MAVRTAGIRLSSVHPLVLDTFIALVLVGIAVLPNAFGPAADAGLPDPGNRPLLLLQTLQEVG